MADGQLNTSLKEVNDLITQLDKNAQDANKHIKDMFSGKVSFTGLDTIKQAMSDILELDAKLSARKQKGKVHYDYGIDPDFVKDATRKISDSLDKSEAELTDNVNKIVRSILTTARFMSVQQISNSSQELGQAGTTVAQNIKDSLMSQLQQNTGLIAQEAQKQAERIKAAYLSATNAATGYGMYQAASRVPVESNAFSQNLSEISSSDYAGVIKQQAAELRASLEAIGVPEMEIINRLKEMSDLATASAEKEIAKVKGVITAYDEWKATLDGIQQKQLELNVKKEAGIFNAQDQQEQLKLINDMRTAKEGIARIDKTTEQVEREMMQKQASDIRRLNELWDENRRLVTRLKELNSKPANERTKSEQELLDKINKKLTTQEVELDNLQNKYRGVAEAEHVFAEQQMRDIENRIRAERDLAKANAPKVSLGSSTGDVTTVSGAYRTQIKLYEEENRLLSEQAKLKDELKRRVATPQDEEYAQKIEARLKEIAKLRKQIRDTPLFAQASADAEKNNLAKQAEQIRKRAHEATMATASWAKENARVATTYQQLKFAADNIRNVLQNTELTKNEARQLSNELKRIEKKIHDCDKQMGIFNNTSNGLINTVSQLAQGFGIMFSLQSVSQFARKIVETRGEFELQEVALKAIVQDSLKGQQIWNETVQNALESPFSVKQLVTYTKQLAAYRIETDKLTDTTKRLADISAGLGVDIQRLILAYGQVKAAAYLRASEVRQFTEAGINMYGELSKYFSEIEGRAVSTADVVERVSKRMVSFEDVAEVFKRLTDEGGTFYNMQEIQSETVRGQVMKLRDAFDLMLNNIGERNQGVIKGIVSALLDMTKHWETIAKVARPVFDYLLMFKVIIPLIRMTSQAFRDLSVRLSLTLEQTYATATGNRLLNNVLKTQGLTLKNLNFEWKGFNVTMKLTNAQGVETTRTMRLIPLLFNTAGAAVNTFKQTLSALWKSNPIGWIITGLTVLNELVYNLFIKTSRLKKLIAEAENELIDEQMEAVANLKRLADEAVSGESAEKQVEALNKLKNAYGDMVPSYMLELDYLASLQGNYDALTESIKSYLAEKAYQKALEDNKEYYSKDVNTDTADLIGATKGENIYGVVGGELKKTGEVTQGLASSIAAQFNQWLKDNEDKVISQSEAIQKYAELFKQMTGDARQVADIVGSIKRDGFIDMGGMDKNIEELVDTHNDIVEDARKIEEAMKSKGSWLQDDFLDKIPERIEEINKNTQTYISQQKRLIALQQQRKRLEELDKKGESRTEAENEEYNRIEQQIKNVERYEQMLSTVKGKITSSMESDLSNSLEVANASRQSVINEYEKDLKSLREEIATFQKQADGGDKTAEKLVTQYQKAYEDLATQAAIVRDDWTTSWNRMMENSINKLKINDAIPAIQTYISGTTAELGKTPKEVGNKLRSTQEEIKATIEQYNRVLIASGQAMAESVTGITKEMIKPLKALGNLFGQKADELLGVKKQGHSHDPFTERLSVIKEMYQEAKKLNQELYASDKSAQEVVKSYKKAFDTAFKGSKDASKVWKTIEESLVGGKGWGATGGGINEEMIAGLESYLNTIKDTKHRAELEKLISQLKVEVQIDDSKEAMDRFKKGIDGYFNDINLTRELQKLHIPVDFYNLFDINAQTTDDVRKKLEEEVARRGYQNLSIEQWDKGFRKYYEETLRKLDEMDDKHQQERMKKYMKYMTGELSAMEKLYYEEQVALREIEETFRYSGDNEEEKKRMKNAAAAAAKGVKDEYKKKINQQVWKDFTGTNMYSVLFGDLDKIADETLDELRRQLNGLKSSMGDLSPTELHQIEVQLRKIDEIQKKRRPLKGMWDDFMMLTKGGRKAAIKEQAEALKNLADANSKLTEAMKKRAALGSRSEYNSAEWDALTTDVNNAQKSVDKYQKEVDDATDKVNAFARAQNNLAEKTEKLGNDIKSITSDVTSVYSNYMEMTRRMGDVNDQVVQSINQMANDFGDAIGNIAKIIASEGSDITAWIGLVASIGAIISDGIDINEASIQKEIDDLTKKINTLSRRVELFQKQMDKAMQMDDYFRNYNSALDSLSAKYNAIQEQYNAEQRKKNPDSEALESYKTQMDEVKDEMDALREKMRQEWGGIGESNFRSSAEEFVDAWMQAFQETGDGLSGLQDNFDEFVKNLFKKQATMRIASKMLEPLFKMIDDMVGEDGTVMRGQLDAIRERAAQIFPELNEALKSLWDELGIGTDATDTLSGLQQGIQGITEATAEVIEGYLNSIRFFIAEDNMMLRQIRDAVQSGAGNAMYMELHAQTILLQRIWDKFDDITTANQTAHTMAVRIVA